MVQNQAAALQDAWDELSESEKNQQFYDYKEKMQIANYFTSRVKDQFHYAQIRDQFLMSLAEEEWGKCPPNSIEHAVRKVIKTKCICKGNQKQKPPPAEGDIATKLGDLQNAIRKSKSLKKAAVELLEKKKHRGGGNSNQIVYQGPRSQTGQEQQHVSMRKEVFEIQVFYGARIPTITKTSDMGT